MNSRDFSALYLYKLKSKHNAAFGNGSVNGHTIWHWYAEFETGNESLTNKDLDRPKTVVDSEIL